MNTIADCEQRAKERVDTRPAGQAGSVDPFSASNQAENSYSSIFVCEGDIFVGLTCAALSE